MSLNLTIDLLNDSVDEPAMSGIYIFAAIVLGFTGFFGFFLNLIVILTVLNNMNILWTSINVVLVNLIVGDLLVVILGNPIAMMSAISGAWYWSYSVCIWYAWFMTTMGFASIGNLTIMAIERFLMVTRPTKMLSIRQAYILVIVVWIYALSLSLPPLFNWGKYGLETSNISCSVSWGHHDPETNNDTYIGLLFIFGFAIPVMIIIASYCGIICTLRNVRRRVRQSNKKEAKVSKMVVLMILAFLVAWMPYAVLTFATQYFYVQASHVMATLPALLAKSSTCYNPIIYASLNVQFFHVWKKMFFRNKDRKKSGKLSKNGTAMTMMNKTGLMADHV